MNSLRNVPGVGIFIFVGGLNLLYLAPIEFLYYSMYVSTVELHDVKPRHRKPNFMWASIPSARVMYYLGGLSLQVV
jgi:hypothetical protein